MSESWIKVVDGEVRVPPGKVLLEQINLDVKKGEMVAILGPNGAGKSTLARMLLGIQKLAAGCVFIDGKSVGQLSRAEMAGMIAYVPQLLGMEIPYTVREFVAMGRYRFAAAAASSDSSVEDALTLVGVQGLAERIVSTLSGGERQRVCIAAALAQGAPMLLLDEPLAHLDPGQRCEVQRVISHLRGQMTILAITHDVHWAGRAFDRILGMKAGRVVYEGEAGDMADVVAKLFGSDASELIEQGGER